MNLRFVMMKYIALIVTIVAAVSYLVYREMDQSAECSSAYNRITELNGQLISLSGRRVSQKQLDIIKQEISKLQLHTAITASDFCSLLQVEIKKELLRDRLKHEITIILDKIEVYDSMMFIKYTVREGPFRYSSPSLRKLELFSYGYAQENGAIRIFVEGL